MFWIYVKYFIIVVIIREEDHSRKIEWTLYFITLFDERCGIFTLIVNVQFIIWLEENRRNEVFAEIIFLVNRYMDVSMKRLK